MKKTRSIKLLAKELLAVGILSLVVLGSLLTMTGHAQFNGGGDGAKVPSNAEFNPTTINLTNFPVLRPGTKTNINVVLPLPKGKKGFAIFPSFFSTNAAAVSNVTFYIDISTVTNSGTFTTTHPISYTTGGNGTSTVNGYYWIDATNYAGGSWWTLSATNTSVTNAYTFTNFVYSSTP